MDYKEIYIELFDFIKNNENKKFINALLKVVDDISFDINIRDNNGKYFLSYAIITNNIEVVNFLTEHNARLDIDNDDNSILTIPIHYSYNDMLEILLKADINTFGSSLVTYRDRIYKIPLHHAISKKNITAVNLLLKYNSNANTADKDGYNSLFYAVKNRSLELCKIILPYISNINAKCTTGENVLHIACSLQLYDIANFLVNNKININVHDNTNEITPLHYSVLVNNKKLIALLLNNGGNINVQDIYGNTPLHYSVIHKNYEIFTLLFGHIFSESQTKINSLISTHNNAILNLWNIEGEIPFHIFLKINYADKYESEYNDHKNSLEINKEQYLEFFIKYSNLNIQNKVGISCLYYIIKYTPWKKYKDLLIKKKLDIFVQNNDKEMITDIVSKNDYNDFTNLIIDSYMYNLQHSGKEWTQEWDIICSKSFDQLSEQDKNKIKEHNTTNITNDVFIKKCKTVIKKKLEKISKGKDITCYNKSYPMIKPIICVDITEGSSLSFCTFTGNILDILMGLIYLLKKHKNTCSILSEEVSSYNFCSQNNYDMAKCELLNFEIVWENKKLNMGVRFIENFIKCIQKKRFVLIPLGIEMDEGSHAGYLIYDAKLKEIERFETYGGGLSLYGTFYNPELLDTLLESKFKEIDEDIKYIKPYHYLPKIGFQLFDIIEKGKKKIGDPIGFCALWSIWYVDMRLTYSEIPRKKLVKILISLIKRENISFKNMIRNYGYQMITIRDNLLEKVNMNINDWINGQYTQKQYIALLEQISKMLKTL
jgi:ankyrin repeat protein